MLTITDTKRTRRSLAGLVAAVALGATLFGATAPAKADASLPSSHVDNVYNGVIYYSGTLPAVSGWAIDPAWPDLTAPQIHVTANVTWLRKPAICAICVPSVVAQGSFTKTANQYRSELVGTAAGPYHGFAFTLAPPAGVSYTNVKVCLTQFGYYGAESLGCYAVVYQPII